MHDAITSSGFLAAVDDDWRIVGDGACACFRTASFDASAQLVTAIAAVVTDLPPAVDVRPAGVTVRLLTRDHDLAGLTRAHVDLARRISAVARAQGVDADPSALESILVIVGAADTAAVMPFWEAILGYERRADTPDEDLVDPRDRGPGFWFETMDEPRADGGGAIHVAVWVPPEEAEARVAAGLAAGGSLVRDADAPSGWVLADAAGNEADVATILGRG